MLFNLVLILTGITSGIALWYLISQKIPELVAIPDEVIVHRLHEDSAQIRVFLLGFRRAWREREHHQIFLRYSEKALYRAHILMLRADNGMVALLKKVRAVLDAIPEANGRGAEAKKELEMPRTEVPRQETLHGMAAPTTAPSGISRPKSSRMQEVRRKRTEEKNSDRHQNAGVTQR